MSGLFLKIVNMSISASWLILAVLICRLVLRKAPKRINVLLWGIVAVRLLLPVSIESELSLIPSAETISPAIMMDASPTIHTGIPAINSAVNPVISQSFAPSPGASANPLQIWIPVFAAVWAVGVAGLLIYTSATYWRLRRRVRTAVLLRDNIFQSEIVSSPFMLGIIRPKIYLPFRLDGQNMDHVIAHELAHIRHRDHWWKPLGFLLLAVYWFNPLMWLVYVLLCRDIELACDESVIKELDNEQKADYTQALLACSVDRRAIAACPLAFGEVGVKGRIKAVLFYKKPAFWVIMLATIVCTAVAVCFLTDPVAAEDAANQRGKGLGTAVVKWFDYLETPEEMHWDGRLEIDLPEFPDVTFRWYPEKMEAVTETEIIPLYSGMPIWSAYFYDLTGDGFPELCSTLSFGSGLIDERIIVYDYANGASYELADRGSYDFTFRLDNGDGCLYVDKKIYDHGSNDSGELVSSGRLSFRDNCIQVEGFSSSPTALSLNDLIDLSQKGYDLSWADFENFDHADIGSGLYIWRFEINDLFSLMIGGGSTNPEVKPMYIYLVANDGTDARIDIRDGGVTEFIDLHKDNPVVIECNAAWQCSSVGYSEDLFWKMVELGGVSERFALSSIQYLPVVRINSTEELQAVTGILSSYTDLDHSAYPDVPAFTTAAEAYNDSFFASSTLFLVYIGESMPAVRHSIAYVRLSNQTLSIGIERLDLGIGDTMMEGWLVAVAVPTDQISDAEEIEARISSTVYADGQLPSGKLIKSYYFEEGNGTCVSLYDSGEFSFMFSLISSYWGHGTYGIEDGRLTLRTDDGEFIYVFNMMDNVLVFDAKASSEQTWFSGMYDGAVLK